MATVLCQTDWAGSKPATEENPFSFASLGLCTKYTSIEHADCKAVDSKPATVDVQDPSTFAILGLCTEGTSIEHADCKAKYTQTTEALTMRNTFLPKAFKPDSETIAAEDKLKPPSRSRLHSLPDWTGCGGNPLGVAIPNLGGSGNCSVDCRACGASTHWRCCGSPDKRSKFCTAFAPAAEPAQSDMPFDYDLAPADVAQLAKPLPPQPSSSEEHESSKGAGAPRHPGNWKRCGGNPAGQRRPALHGKCSPSCENCGASTHWSCCGSVHRRSEFCLSGTTLVQARINASICLHPYDLKSSQPLYSQSASVTCLSSNIKSTNMGKTNKGHGIARRLRVTALTLAGEEAATVDVDSNSHVLNLKAALKAVNKKLVQFEVLLLDGKKPLQDGASLHSAFRAALAEHAATTPTTPLPPSSEEQELASIDVISVTVTLVQLPPTFEHKGSWSGCGGNPQGVSKCRGCGNCSADCSNCGAASHWSCCGSTVRKAKFCAMGTPEEQAVQNAKLCYEPFSASNDAPAYSC